MQPIFLSVEDVLVIHADQVELYGGDSGVRDIGLLESALAQPKAMFGGVYLHEDIFDMAGAYLFNIVKNHPFVDGNKRAGLVTALVFLDTNGLELNTPEGSLYELTLAVATGTMDKLAIAQFFRERSLIQG